MYNVHLYCTVVYRRCTEPVIQPWKQVRKNSPEDPPQVATQVAGPRERGADQLRRLWLLQPGPHQGQREYFEQKMKCMCQAQACL